ncbi:MAG: hypothetical protein AAGK92_01690 [Pseudomonadota bacterium]
MTDQAPLKDRATDAVEQSIETAQKTVSKATEQATDEIHKLTEAGTKFVRDNPGAAIAGALGVGILVGLALRGRD